MSVFGLGEEDNEERQQPLKSFGALVDFDIDAKFVLDHYLEVLAIGLYPNGVRFNPIPVGIPDRSDLFGETNAGGVELDAALVEGASVTVESFFIVLRLMSVNGVREFASREAEQLEQAQVPIIVAVIV